MTCNLALTRDDKDYSGHFKEGKVEFGIYWIYWIYEFILVITADWGSILRCLTMICWGVFRHNKNRRWISNGHAACLWAGEVRRCEARFWQVVERGRPPASPKRKHQQFERACKPARTSWVEAPDQNLDSLDIWIEFNWLIIYTYLFCVCIYIHYKRTCNLLKISSLPSCQLNSWKSVRLTSWMTTTHGTPSATNSMDGDVAMRIHPADMGNRMAL